MVGWGGGSGSSSSEAGGLVRTLKKSFNLCQKLSPRILICAQFLRTCPCIAPLRPAAYTVLAWLLGVRRGGPTPPPPPTPNLSNPGELRPGQHFAQNAKMETIFE